MSIKHYFHTQQVEMTDNSTLFEIVSPDGERVASATEEAKLKSLEIALNMALTDAAEEDSDIEINCP